MVRAATFGDVPAVLPLMADFHQACGYDFAFDASHLERTLRRLIASASGVVLVLVDGEAIDGFLLGSFGPHPFCRENVAFEMAWWIAPSARSACHARAMLDEFEVWAEGNGCVFASVSNLHGLAGARVAKLYQHRGYVPRETAFFKRLA